MKKLVMIICAIVLGVAASTAQVHKGEVAAGINLGYGSLTESLGLGAKIQYGIIDNVRAEFAFNGFLKHDHVKAFDLNINGHYLVGLYQQKLYIYPLVGLNYTMATYKDEFDKDEENHIGLNLGAGAEYEFTEHLGAIIGYRHTIERKIDQGVIMFGVNYKF